MDLNDNMIWTDAAPAKQGYLHAGFRRGFQLEAAPTEAKLRIFAYTRYELFVNGEYVGRGPSRHELARPEFDEWDVKGRLIAGRNVVAVLVHRDVPSGRVREHAPGVAVQLGARLAGGGEFSLATDGSWSAFAEASYGPERAVWASFEEHRDARAMPGDWTAVDFDASKLPVAVKVAADDRRVWPEVRPRTIPLLRETTVECVTTPGEKASADGAGFAVEDGGEIRVEAPRILQAYWDVEIEAEAGVKIEATPLLPEGHKGATNSYITRAGKQTWRSGDTWGLKGLAVKVTCGRARLSAPRLVEVLYPFDRVGSFVSSDEGLNKTWDVATRSVMLLSEDAYVDCADRERVEWMDCDPPAYDVTRVALAGPGEDGKPLFSDPRLFKDMLLRTALTQREDGMVKAHTCSERWDIHAIMEDRACDWVEGLRKYEEATGDDAFIAEIWPRVEKLLEWFLTRRTERGLVNAREWVAWDNPMSYATCEGAANNAFIYRALKDGAYLAGCIGRTDDASRLGVAADALAADFNKQLWVEGAGAYAAACGTPVLKHGDDLFKKKIDLKVVDGLVEPTLHANLFALDRGIVPPERRGKVVAWTLAHADQIKQVMANHFYFKLLYALDMAECDQQVIDRIRKGWKGMAESPWQTTWEGMNGGSKVHIYGAVPGHTLSTYVLGVRRDLPVGEGRLVIQPHLADLAFARGTVSTELGLVEVSWKKSGDAFDFEFTVPEGAQADVYLPAGTKRTVTLDGEKASTLLQGRWQTLTVGAGKHAGQSL
jgi:hypothetical protein